MQFEYLPFEERFENTQYHDALQEIINYGTWSEPTRQGPRCLTRLGIQMRFDLLSDGFPVITDRSMKSFWRKPINELGAMMNGVHTVEGFKAWGCDWWESWGSEAKCSKRGLQTGDIGPSSYGPAFHNWPENDGSLTFDQFEHLLAQIVEFPNDRTHLVSPWNSAGLARDSGRVNLATIAPCHGWVQVRILNGKLNLHMKQRSGDMPIGVPSNLVQYGALMLLLCEITGLEPGEYIHYVVDAHIYEDQIEHVEMLLQRKPKRLPTIHLACELSDFDLSLACDDKPIHRLHSNLFELSDYNPHPAIPGIRVAI
ncbi:thymidylate synthase [Candidatus Saccharibacteria bacterium]|nr:thymidylate synthase [Candidatus Saccharibacteria bacterium]